ncbi:MAG: fimbrial protein [Prevotella sp.]
MKKLVKTLKVMMSVIIAANSLISCEKVNVEEKDNEKDKVVVNITFSDFNYYFDEDDTTTRASDKTPTEAGINRIALAVFNSDGELVFETTKNESVDVDDFSQISCALRPGDYSFVVVAHQANGNENAAAISAMDKATITTAKLLKTFAVKQAVTVIADQANNVVIDMGKRVSSQFMLKILDAEPTEVTSCEIILNPSATASTDFVFNPSTGFASDLYQYKNVFQKSAINGGTFKEKLLGLHCLVTENPQNVDVTINMKDASGNVVKSRTLTDVPMAPHRVTRATGNFFGSLTKTNFLFDTEDDPAYDISL